MIQDFTERVQRKLKTKKCNRKENIDVIFEPKMPVSQCSQQVGLRNHMAYFNLKDMSFQQDFVTPYLANKTM